MMILSRLFSLALLFVLVPSITVCPEEITEGVYSFYLTMPIEEEITTDTTIVLQLDFDEVISSWVGIDWYQNGIIDSVYKPLLGSYNKQLNITLHNESGDWNGWNTDYLSDRDIKGLILTPHKLIAITFNFEEDTDEVNSILADTEGKSDVGPVHPLPYDKPIPNTNMLDIESPGIN